MPLFESYWAWRVTQPNPGNKEQNEQQWQNDFQGWLRRGEIREWRIKAGLAALQEAPAQPGVQPRVVQQVAPILPSATIVREPQASGSNVLSGEANFDCGVCLGEGFSKTDGEFCVQCKKSTCKTCFNAWTTSFKAQRPQSRVPCPYCRYTN